MQASSATEIARQAASEAHYVAHKVRALGLSPCGSSNDVTWAGSGPTPNSSNFLIGRNISDGTTEQNLKRFLIPAASSHRVHAWTSAVSPSLASPNTVSRAPFSSRSHTTTAKPPFLIPSPKLNRSIFKSKKKSQQLDSAPVFLSTRTCNLLSGSDSSSSCIYGNQNQKQTHYFHTYSQIVDDGRNTVLRPPSANIGSTHRQNITMTKQWPESEMTIDQQSPYECSSSGAYDVRPKRIVSALLPIARKKAVSFTRTLGQANRSRLPQATPKVVIHNPHAQLDIKTKHQPKLKDHITPPSRSPQVGKSISRNTASPKRRFHISDPLGEHTKTSSTVRRTSPSVLRHIASMERLGASTRARRVRRWV